MALFGAAGAIESLLSVSEHPELARGEGGKSERKTLGRMQLPCEHTGKQRKRAKAFKYKQEAVAFEGDKQAEVNRGEVPAPGQDVMLGQLCDEFLRFLNEVSEVRLRGASWLMSGCGLRPGEVCNLTADEIR